MDKMNNANPTKTRVNSGAPEEWAIPALNWNTDENI
jgi:hypothetical protein